MNDRYRLGGVANDRLLASLSALVRRESDSLSDLLAHLAELDERGLCLELGYSSLFKYCVEALGFCESSAGRRIAAARVCRKYPEAFGRVANGELKLSVLVALNKYLSPENAAELFAACSRKSYEQVELLLAARFPKPDVRDLVRRLPARTESTPDIGCAPTSTGAMSVSSAGYPGGAELSGGPLVPLQVVPLQPSRASRAGAVKPLSAERFSVNFTADAEFRELLEEVRGLVSHAEPRGDLMSVMKRGLKALKSDLLKRRYGVGRKPRRVRMNAVGTGLAARTRHVAADVSRAVWERDGGQCPFCSALFGAALPAARSRSASRGGRQDDDLQSAVALQSAQSACGADLLWGEVHARVVAAGGRSARPSDASHLRKRAAAGRPPASTTPSSCL